MTHVRTSPYYPQSNGKIERWHKSLKGECIRPGTPLTKEDARQLIQQYVDHYNAVRLHSAIGFVTPADMLADRQAEIHRARDRKLEEARQQRQIRRQQAALTMLRDNLVDSSRRCCWGAEIHLSRPSHNTIGSVDPHALKIPAPKGVGYS
jgi:hypothetical protein